MIGRFGGFNKLVFREKKQVPFLANTQRISDYMMTLFVILQYVLCSSRKSNPKNDLPLIVGVSMRRYFQSKSSPFLPVSVQRLKRNEDGVTFYIFYS